METKPRSRLGILVFSFVFLAIAGAIAATVLLANNRRNLNHLMRSLGLEVTETMVIPKPGTMEKFKGKRLKDVGVMLDTYVLMPEIKDKQSAFLRSMRRDGGALCDALKSAGFAMSAWQPGTFTKAINECWSEVTIPNAEKSGEPSSFFVMIKGSKDGTLISTRVKFIFSDLAARTRLIDMAVKVVEGYSKATGWTEVAEQKGKIVSLTPFETSLSGFSTKFSAEFSGAGRYNLIFNRVSRLSPAQKRTDAFFDRAKFFPLLPEYGGPAIAIAPTKT